MNVFRIILYRHFQNRWQYKRMSAPVEGAMTLESGVCGMPPEQTEKIALKDGADPQAALTQQAQRLLNLGWRLPHPQKDELAVMSLHFRMPRWSGYPAGAPWFDAWSAYYLEPIKSALFDHCNAFHRGDERFSGNYLFHYSVLNPDLAMEALEKIAEKAPEKFIFDIHIGRREKQVYIPIDPNIPEYLQALFRVVEKSARTIAGEIPTLFPSDPLKPELAPNGQAGIPVRGEESREIRKQLKQIWNFDCNYWNPMAESAPSEVVFVYGFPADKQEALKKVLSDRISGPLYRLDCEYGLFQIDLDYLFHGNFEGMVFDTEMQWVIYFSHQAITTFGGEFLVESVKKLYVEQPELLNRW